MHLPDEDKTTLYWSRDFLLQSHALWVEECWSHLPADGRQNIIVHAIEVYVVDMLVKSTQVPDHLRHLSEAFNLLWKYKVKLNPKNARSGWPLRSS